MNYCLYVPEGMAANPKRVLRNLDSNAGRESLSERSHMKLTKGVKATDLKNQGLNYRFKLHDLKKYSQRLKPRDSKFKFERSALGKIIPEAGERRKKLKNASYFSKLLKLLKHTDWQRTPIYH
jgi:hypothetical protein